MGSLFISHSSLDNKAAEDLMARLEARGHRSLFLDLDPQKGIQAGASWERTLYTKLRACRAVVALCSHNYLSSHWCFAELALARMEGKAIFALQIDPWNSKGKKKTTMPSILTEGQYTDLRTDPEGGYERLWNAFKVHGIVPSEHREWGPADPPYPGLRAFEEEDAPIFFGRDEVVQEGVELLTRVRRQGHPRLVLVLGASGSGKSSLARAGVVPRLRRDPSQWLVVDPFRPGTQPALRLAYALGRKFEESGHALSEAEILDRLEPAVAGTPDVSASRAVGREAATERLLAALVAFEKELTPRDTWARESLESLKSKVRERESGAPGRAPAAEMAPGASPLAELASRLRRDSEASVVLVIDQFEELLGHEDEDPDRPHPTNRFLQLLREALDAEDSPLLVLGTMRSDFLETFQKSPALLGVGFKKLSLGPMSRDGMRRMIEEPATLGHLELEKGLTDLLLDETGTSDALPILAFTLRVMWDRYTNESDRLLTIRDYRALGGLQGSLAMVADEALEGALQKGEEAELRDAFLSLVRPAAEGAGWSRRPVAWHELERVHPMIQHFVDQRLLVTQQDGVVEVAHEALFRSWETLRGWLSENSEALRLRGEIGISAEKWKAADDEEKELYYWRKGRLQRAVELRDDGHLSLSEDELKFLELSEEAENRARLRKRRRLQWLLAGASVVAAGMTILAVLAFLGQRRAQIQAAKALTIQARTAGYPLDQSLLIAVETSRTLERLKASQALDEARTTLLGSLLAYPQLTSFLHGHEDQIWALAMGPKGELLASGGTDGRLLLWRDGRPQWNLDPCKKIPLPPDDRSEPCDDILKEAAFSPLGDWLVSSSDKGRILVWDTSTGELRAELAAEGRPVEGLAVSSDGRVVASDVDGKLRLWSQIADPGGEVELGSLAEPDGQTIPLWRLAVTPSGEVLSVGGDRAIHLWRLPSEGASAGPAQVLCRGGAGVVGLAASASGTVAVGFATGTFRLWTREALAADRRSGAETPRACTASGAGVLAPRDPQAAAGAEDQVHEGEVNDLAFSPDGRILASAAADGTVKLWATDTEELTQLAELGGHSRGALSVQIGPDGTVATGAGDGRLRLWDGLRAEARFLSFKDGQDLSRVGMDGGQLLAAGDKSGTVQLIGLPDLRTELSFVPRGREVTTQVMGVAIDPAGRYLAAAAQYIVYLWELAELEGAGSPVPPEPLLQYPSEGWIWGLAFSPDGSRLASFDHQGNVYVTQLPGGSPEKLLGPGTSVRSLVFGPRVENPVLAIGRADGAVEVRSSVTGDPLDGFRGEPGHLKKVMGLAFSPDGRLLASASSDNTVRLWRTDQEREPLVLEGHEAQLSAVAFGLDARQLASADVDGVIKIWDAETGLSQFALLGHEDEVKGLAFRQGGWLISGAKDKTFRRWEIGIMNPLEAAYARACTVANRSLSRAEWTKFFGSARYRQTCPDRESPASR